MVSSSVSEELPTISLSTEKSEVDEERVPKEHARGAWDNKVQFILTCLGCAVGLGNIWRFPSRAYENGGSAFLIPYICCGFFFGLPVVYSEFLMGQYAGVGSMKIFPRYAPAAQGIGWAMAFQEITVSTYYTVILTWSAVYIGYVVSGQSYKWNNCENDWNTAACVSGTNYEDCLLRNASMPFYDPFLKDCVTEANNLTSSATKEFFENHITKRSSGILDISEMNWYVAVSLLFMWLFIAAALIKGIRILGYLSYITATVPYLIIFIFFIRGVTLPGAWEGIKLYLFSPDMEKILTPMTWANALQQLAFSLTIGTGALMTMASYNKMSNNCFRDALIVVCGDTLMSVIGGVAVFSVLGFLSQRTGKEIEQLVESGPSLAFIIYPEAMAMLPLHQLWEFLFFVMFLLLGVSTESVMVQTLATCLCDQFAFFRRHSWLPVVATCSLFFILGIIMCTDAGWYWFLVSDEFTGSAGLTMIIALTFITLAYVYGVCNVKKDLETMFGKPAPLSSIRRWFGRQSPIWLFSWLIVCPAAALIITGILFVRDEFKATVNGVEYVFPLWATVFGWFTTLGPLLAIPFFFFRSIWIAVKTKQPLMSVFQPQASLHEKDPYVSCDDTTTTTEDSRF